MLICESMTLIIGARCKNGVVIVSDLLSQRGTENKVVRKLYKVLNNTVVGAAGTRGISILLMGDIIQQVSRGQIQDSRQLIRTIEDLSLEYAQRYIPRGQDLELVFAIRESAATLYIADKGVSEPIHDFIAIGHGSPHVSIFLKQLYKPETTMEEFVEIATFSIRYVMEQQLDNSVGAGVEVFYLPDLPIPAPSDANELAKFEIKEEFPPIDSTCWSNATKRLKLVQDMLDAQKSPLPP